MSQASSFSFSCCVLYPLTSAWLQVLKCALVLCASALGVGYLQGLAAAFFIIRSSVTAASIYSQDIPLLNSFHPMATISFCQGLLKSLKKKERLEMATLYNLQLNNLNQVTSWDESLYIYIYICICTHNIQTSHLGLSWAQRHSYELAFVRE